MAFLEEIVYTEEGTRLSRNAEEVKTGDSVIPQKVSETFVAEEPMTIGRTSR